MRTRNGLLAVVLALGLVAASCTSSGRNNKSVSMTSDERPATVGEHGGSGSGTDGSAGLAWASCDSSAAAAAKLQCSQLEVPVDPAEPDGSTTSLALARQPATGSEDSRIGSLILNPGGPGGSGIEFLASAAGSFPDEIRERFDLVSFDPRGVAESDPVHCLDDKAKARQLKGDLSPDTPEELERALREQKEFLEGCKENSPEMLRHMSTADVAADLDRIRAAVGDEKLSYVGFSYGTAIGAVYATLFPERTRALVLDGSVSPSADPVEETKAQVLGFEHTLKNFIDACDADRGCAIGPDAKRVIDRTRAALTKRPIKVSTPSGTRELGVDLFDLGLATALYDTALWGTAAHAIHIIDDGGGALILSLVDRQTGRQPDGTFDNSSDAQTMVSCADEDERLTPSEAEDAAREIQAAAPLFGQALAWNTLSCLGWPRAANPVPEITGSGAAPLLVVGTVGDPATPYEWSQQMTAALESARLLTYEGDGHTAFLRGGPCIDNTVVAYLTDLKVPPEGKRCAAAEKHINFSGLSDEVIRQLVEAGLPEDLARCVIDGVIDQVGVTEFNRMVLEEDTAALSRAVTAQTLSCASSSRD